MSTSEHTFLRRRLHSSQRRLEPATSPPTIFIKIENMKVRLLWPKHDGFHCEMGELHPCVEADYTRRLTEDRKLPRYEIGDRCWRSSFHKQASGLRWPTCSQSTTDEEVKTIRGFGLDERCEMQCVNKCTHVLVHPYLDRPKNKAETGPIPAVNYHHTSFDLLPGIWQQKPQDPTCVFSRLR